MNEEFMLKINLVVQALQAYHRYEVSGLEHVPQKGPAIIACSHSLATYDIMLLMGAVHGATGRFPRSLIDRLFYKVPGLGQVMEMVGSVIGKKENAIALLNNGELLYVAPGGMRESLRTKSERYQVRWENRKGFIRLSIESGAPIILAACPWADDIYDVYPMFFTEWAYKTFKVPMFLARGLGLSPIPKPVKLKHFMSEPIAPPKMKRDSEAFEKQLNAHHKLVTKKMIKLLKEATASQDSKPQIRSMP